jgi:hypothetical protein
VAFLSKNFCPHRDCGVPEVTCVVSKPCAIVQEDAYQRHAVVMHKVVNVRHHVRVEVCVPIVTHVSAQATVLRFGADVRKRV